MTSVTLTCPNKVAICQKNTHFVFYAVNKEIFLMPSEKTRYVLTMCALFVGVGLTLPPHGCANGTDTEEGHTGEGRAGAAQAAASQPAGPHDIANAQAEGQIRYKTLTYQHLVLPTFSETKYIPERGTLPGGSVRGGLTVSRGSRSSPPEPYVDPTLKEHMDQLYRRTQGELPNVTLTYAASTNALSAGAGQEEVGAPAALSCLTEDSCTEGTQDS
jgi:hypothetical protein